MYASHLVDYALILVAYSILLSFAIHAHLYGVPVSAVRQLYAAARNSNPFPPLLSKNRATSV